MHRWTPRIDEPAQLRALADQLAHALLASSPMTRLREGPPQPGNSNR
jgi:hypothetical protein